MSGVLKDMPRTSKKPKLPVLTGKPHDKVVVTRFIAERYGADHLADCATFEIEGCTCGFAKFFYPDDDTQVEKRLVKHVRELLRETGNGNLVPAARDGVRLFNYLFDTTRAAEMVTPPLPGLDVVPVEVSSTRARAQRAMAVCAMIEFAVKQGLAAGKLADKL